MEDPVSAIGADGEGLGVVFEGVWRGLGAFVVDLEAVVIFDEDELRRGAGVLDRAGGDVAGDAKMGGVGLVAHAVELRDGDVVALVGAIPGERQVGDGAHDYEDGDGDLDGLIAALFHILLFIEVRHPSIRSQGGYNRSTSQRAGKSPRPQLAFQSRCGAQIFERYNPV